MPDYIGEDFDTFTTQYVETALWSSIGENGQPLDDDFDLCDLAPQFISEATEDCKNFREANAELLARAIELGSTSENNAHNYWLTRNGHGAGFRDRGLGEVGTKLTEACKVYGSVDLYVGDDQLVYSN